MFLIRQVTYKRLYWREVAVVAVEGPGLFVLKKGLGLRSVASTRPSGSNASDLLKLLHGRPHPIGTSDVAKS